MNEYINQTELAKRFGLSRATMGTVLDKYFGIDYEHNGRLYHSWSFNKPQLHTLGIVDSPLINGRYPKWNYEKVRDAIAAEYQPVSAEH